ncbi:unnamed protein product [Prorocentrum cordatum]|uniref:Uncharacterized protein n=1 Tax=Prorocentrum cordatum TaxID=2364126 RepID=A0ABN9QP43_9DINO|nr:unnamed protein product [Polarella glacialis]
MAAESIVQSAGRGSRKVQCAPPGPPDLHSRERSQLHPCVPPCAKACATPSTTAVPKLSATPKAAAPGGPRRRWRSRRGGPSRRPAGWRRRSSRTARRSAEAEAEPPGGEHAELDGWLLGLDGGAGAMLQYRDALIREFDGDLVQITAVRNEETTAGRAS